MNRAYIRAAIAALALAASAAAVPAQSSAPAEHSAKPWWQHAVFYEIYPRSYKDTNGDGTGDINGITEKLGYLKVLGVNAIWIAPAYPSPQVDFGYDISNYETVDPQYGTLKDMENLIAEAKKHDIRIILDMVLNHTSDKHPWFIESASNRTNPKADWYMWSDGKIGPDGKPMPPNNWTSGFGGSAWEWVPARHQFYYHKFYKEQPDLNWRNPAVEKAMFDEMRFWLDRGVAGFRLDAIDTLLEDPSNTDEEIRKDENGKPKYLSNGDPDLIHSKTNNLPEEHDIIRRMRKMVESYPGDRVLIGETYLPNIAELDKWYGGQTKDELQLPMDTQVGLNSKFSAAEWRRTLGEVETQVHGSMPLLVIDNHDNPRMDRYCKMQNVPEGPECYQLQKMLTTVLFTARDAALFYYGDEIGMRTTDPTRKEDVKDPVGRRFWPEYKGRDGERTPMQWTPGKNAGFSTAETTWLPVAPDYKTVNVEVETPEKTSMLNWYKRLLEMRRTNDVLNNGDFMMEDAGNPDVLAYSRTLNGKTIAVAANFTGQPQQVNNAKLAGKKIKILAATQHEGMTVTAPATSTLPPYGVAVVEVQ